MAQSIVGVGLWGVTAWVGLRVPSLPVVTVASAVHASWFRSLADPTRIQILHLLATNDGPLTVGQIVQQVSVGQSTVSHHLKVLAQVRFVTVVHAGTSSRYQVNPRCLVAFPTAADVVMGQTPTT